MTIGTFATGYDCIPVKVWCCPRHGRVSNAEMAWSPDGWYHVGCGKTVAAHARKTGREQTHAA